MVSTYMYLTQEQYMLISVRFEQASFHDILSNLVSNLKKKDFIFCLQYLCIALKFHVIVMLCRLLYFFNFINSITFTQNPR